MTAIESMRDFISFHLKRKGIGIDDLLASCNIGRSMFYRFLKEPFRFSDEQLELIADVISLSDKEKLRLYAFKSEYRHVDSAAKAAEDEIPGILFSNPYEFRANKIDFEYYDFEKDTTFVLDTDGFVDVISGHIAQMEHLDASRFKLCFTIYNCTSAQKVSSIYGLLFGLEKKIKQKINTFRIIHYINYQQDDLLSKLKMLKVNLPMYSTFPDYHLINTDLTAHPWAGHIDFFVLKYGYEPDSKAVKQRYIVGNMKNSRRAYAYSTDSYALYKFFTCGIDDQTAEMDYDSDVNPMEVNRFFQNLLSASGRILITQEPCYDALIPSIWDNLMERAINNVPNLKRIRTVLDPNDAFSIYSDAQVLEFCIKTLQSRFESNEKNETINILTTDGLETFITQSMTTDALVLGETFSKAEIALQLEYIKSRLGDSASSGQQSFYIFNAKFKQPIYWYSIFKNRLIAVCSAKRVNPLLTTALLKDKAVADAMYNYVLYELIDKRGGADSLLMSDSEAGAFLDTLISRTR